MDEAIKGLHAPHGVTLRARSLRAHADKGDWFFAADSFFEEAVYCLDCLKLSCFVLIDAASSRVLSNLPLVSTHHQTSRRLRLLKLLWTPLDIVCVRVVGVCWGVLYWTPLFGAGFSFVLTIIFVFPLQSRFSQCCVEEPSPARGFVLRRTGPVKWSLTMPEFRRWQSALALRLAPAIRSRKGRIGS